LFPVVKVVHALLVCTISSFQEVFKTSQVQPEPKLERDNAVNFSLNSLKLQKSEIIFSRSFQVGSHHQFGERQFQ